MQWKNGSGIVVPQDLVKEVTIQHLISAPAASRAEIAKAGLSKLTTIFGKKEVTLRGLQDQVSAVFKQASEAAEENRVDLLSLISLDIGRVPGPDQVHLVYWNPQNDVRVYFQQVASRLYGRQMAPWNSVAVGDVIVGKMSARPVFGYTSVEQVKFERIEVGTEKELAAKVAETKDVLAKMAKDIPAEAKLLVEDTKDSKAYWKGTANFAEAHRGKLVSYVTLVTFAPWTQFEYPGAALAEGLCYIDFAIGKGPAASWWAGGSIVQALSTNCTWRPPRKRGRKPKPTE